MDKKTVFIKTAKGENEIANLSGDLRRALSLIDNRSTVDELSRRAPPSLREDLYEVLGELLAGEYIRDRDRAVSAPKITPPKITPPKMFVPKPSGGAGELDFTSLGSGSAKPMGKEDEEALARAELEIAMAQSGNRVPVEDEDSKQARLKAKVAAAEKARSSLEAGIDAAKARASAEAAAKAEAKAKQEAEMAARAKAAAEAKALQEATIRAQAESKAKLEAAARVRAEQEAARAKAALEVAARAKAEAEAKVRAEIEAAAKAKQIAEAKAKQEAAEAKARQEAEAAKLKAEEEAARVRAELEAAAKAKAAAEAARIQAELEAARVKAELEAAKARAEAEAKALAEAIAKREAEEKARREAEAARLKAEQEAEAARVRAEQEAEAARLKAEQEAAARAKLEAETRARIEAEARAKAEQEAAAKAKQETEARAKAESEARLRAEAEARVKAEEQRKREAEEQARQQAAAASSKNKGAATGSFKLDLDHFSENVPAAEPPRMLDDERENQARAKAEAEARAKREAEQQAKAESGEKAKKDMTAEMARLKAEADAARLKAEEEARRQAEERALAEEQAKAWAEAEQRALAQAKIDAEMAAQQAVLAQAKETTKSAPRAKRAPLPWGKISGGLVVLALIAAVALPYVYPLQEYIPQIEQRLAAQMKQPVKIGAISAASIPPRLNLQNVTVGIEQEVKVASVELNFDLLSLFSETRAIGDAVLDDVSIKGNQLERFSPSMLLAGGDKHFPVRHFTLRKVKVVTEELALPNLSGVAELDAQGAFSRVALHSDDEKYSFDLQPVQGRWQLGVSLKETALPWLPGVVFSDLNAKGNLGDGEVDFNEIDGHIFKGILLGSAKLNWRKGWQLQGRLEAKLFELDKMFPANGVEGEMYGEGTFAFSGPRFSQLGESPRLDASFTVKGGNVNAIDMVETARLLSREHMVGGRTRFDDMIGVVQVENHNVHFRQLKILSNMLSANGSFDVGTGGQLSGSFNAEIKMRAGSNPLTLYGTLAEPKLRAGR